MRQLLLIRLFDKIEKLGYSPVALTLHSASLMVKGKVRFLALSGQMS